MKIPENVKIALDLLDKAGFEAFLVGGCVRDSLMGRLPYDYDMTTPSTPDETKAVFEGFSVFLQGEKHGTVGVIINGEKLEITTHRCDGEYLDHRRPESVTFSRRLADDLSRRDFTVNAMAYSEKTGLVDLFGGREDIENGVIRCVGDPDRRFDEDALRILRALRFSSKIGFGIEENTKKSIFKNAHLLRTVSAERIRDELEKLVCGKNADGVIREYREILELLFGKIDTELFSIGINRLEDPCDRLALFFCATDGDGISRLKFSNELSSFYKKTRRLFFEKRLETKYELKKAVSDNGESALLCALRLKGETDTLSLLKKMLADGECMHRRDMKINGSELASVGFEQGTLMGCVLDTLFELVLRDELENDREKILEYAVKLRETH
ncbi:MAG: hypothetical protein IKV53_04680 [Clostridia bacterium]|nr:hypothetical protein [Clostridia bacterium]